MPCNTRLVDRRDGLPIGEVSVRAADGRKLEMNDMRWIVIEQDEQVPGPNDRAAVG